VRIVLTFIAVALVAALSAALVAPVMIDWSRWRGYFEAELSKRAGAAVTIGGRIEVRLLPTPYVKLDQVAVAGPTKDDEPVLRCDRMRFELAIGGLFGGQLRFTDVRLDRPVARLDLNAGAPAQGWRAAVVESARRVALDRVVVYQGEAIIARPDMAPLVLSNIELDASAGSLIGPFRGAGEMSTRRGGVARFQFVTAEIADATLPIKAAIDAAEGPRATFDGKLSLAPGGGLDLAYDGAATLAGNVQAIEGAAPSPWSVSGVLRADARHARIEKLAASLGPESRALQAMGTLDADLGEWPSLALDLQSKQLNIDAFLRRDGEEAAPPSRVWTALSNIAANYAWPGGSPMALKLNYSAPLAYLGAQSLDDLSLSASAKAGEPLAIDVRSGLPGQSHAHFTGGLELGAAAGFHGRVEADVGDFHGLRDWLARDQADWAARLAAAGDAFPYASGSAKGDVEISTVGFSARNLDLTLDRSRFSGAMAFTAAVAGARPRLFLDLSSDGLDVDAAPDLSGGADWLGDLDLSLTLQASKLRVAQVGRASVESGSLDLKATRTGDRLSLDHLVLANLGGATVRAEGEAGPGGRWIRVHLDAARLREFAALVSRVAPGRYSRALVDRAEALSPAKATFEARRDGPPLQGVFPLDFVRADGDAGRSHFGLRLSRAPAPVDALAADLTLDSPDGAALLRQLGVKSAGGSATRAHLAASASGKWETGFDGQVAGTLVGTDLSWRGRIVPADASAFGPATLKSENLLNALAALGLAAPGAGVAAPVDIASDIEFRGGEVTAPRITGTVAGGKVVANLAWKAPAAVADVGSLDPDVALAKMIAGEAPASAPTRLSGEISMDKASAGALLAMSLGPPSAAKSGARWSEAKFAPALLAPPSSDIWLKIASLDFLEGVPARDVSARIQMDAGKFELDDIAMDVAGGRASGRLTLRRDGADATVNGHVAVESMAVERAAFRGRLGVSMDFVSTGASPMAVVAGLVGQGQAQLAAASLPRLDPGALARVLAKAESADGRIDETNIAHALNLELDKQPLPLPDGPSPAVLNSGVVRVGPMTAQGPSGHVVVTAEFDLRAFSLGVRAVCEEAHGDRFWSGPPPSVTVSARGSLDAPARKIDVDMLTAGLAGQAIARESDRISAFEADMRERAFFNRQLKAEHFLARRDAEIAAYEAEQARLKSEAERKRVQDDLLKARDDQVKADAAARPPAPLPSRAFPTPEAKPRQGDSSPTGLY
jgi:uncharacterized protein involved in outer membrane biogenesis